MKREVVIVIAEDDEGHATLIRKNLERAGIRNKILHFKNGEETLDFFFKRVESPEKEKETACLLLLDIRMPMVDGYEVLKRLKADKDLRKMPVIMITTTNDPKEVQKCHELGCSNYIAKPIQYDRFTEAIRQLGLFLLVVEVPDINGQQCI